MSLIGDCIDCGGAAQLHYKPSVPLEDQPRPTVCAHCRDRRRDFAERHRIDVDARRAP